MFNGVPLNEKTQLVCREESLLQNLIHQLNKDLGVEKFHYPIENLSTVLDGIESILIQNQNDLGPFLYRVDLSEKQTSSVEDFRSLSILVLERVAEKIIFRHQYKNP